MSKSNDCESDFLLLLFNATNWGLVADNTVTSPLTQLFISLHTADPGEAGNQTTSEATYGGYSRIAVNRNSGGWTVSGTAPTQAANTAQLTVPTWTSGATNILTYFAVGAATSGASAIFYSGALTNPVTMSAGNPTATIAAGALVCTED